MVFLVQCVGLALAGWLSYEWHRFRIIRRKVEHIPAVGPDNFLGAYLSAWKFFICGQRMIEEGYKKYHGGVFRVATFETSSRWLIIGAGPQFADDIRRTNDEMMDVVEPAIEYLQMDWTFGAGKDMRHRDGEHHLMALKGLMTRNLASCFGDIQKEVEISFKAFLPATEGWASYPVRETLLHIVTQTTNRFFIGLPLCRDREYCVTMEKFAGKFILSAYAINLSPAFLRPIIARFTSNAEGTLKVIQARLGPTIEARLKEGSDKSNDMITWLLDCAPDRYRNVDDVVFRLLLTNFAAIHSTTITISDILFHLAVHQEYIAPLRVEIEDVVGANGWTRDAMAQLHKLDSFMKEVARMGGVQIVAGTRKTKKDFTFSNGVTVPKGFTITSASGAQHYDPSLYEHPDVFDGNRFLAAKGADQGDGLKQAKQQMVALDTKYLLFGLGRHACPGRFLAVNELKAIAGYVLLNYDVKLEGEANVPPGGLFFGTARSANVSARILFRKRRS